ncbi:MAG TPA: hypothetical protein VGV35_04620 [Bryobacteraceae bacterium]|nr:hypothetical protein [Bryobacteraceae bacterium]
MTSTRLANLPEGDQRGAIAHAEMLSPEGDPARADPDGIALLGLGVQFAELWTTTGALGEVVAEVAGQRECQARADKHGKTDAAD